MVKSARVQVKIRPVCLLLLVPRVSRMPHASSVCVCVLEQKLTFPEVLPCMKAQAMTESQEERKACRPNAPKRRKSRAQCKLGKFSYESRMASLKRAKKRILLRVIVIAVCVFLFVRKARKKQFPFWSRTSFGFCPDPRVRFMTNFMSSISIVNKKSNVASTANNVH